MSIFYNTLRKSWRELKDFLTLFFFISFLMALCGFVIFGYGASHPDFASFGGSLFTTFGIAFGHVDRETVVGQTFGLDPFLAEVFYWILMLVMFLMLNILLAIIIDAFDKNQDDRRTVDKPLYALVATQPIRNVFRKCCAYCKKRNKENSLKLLDHLKNLNFNSWIVGEMKKKDKNQVSVQICNYE